MTIAAIEYRLCDCPEDHAAIRRLFADGRSRSSSASDALDAPDVTAWIALSRAALVGAILTRPMRSEEDAELGGVN